MCLPSLAREVETITSVGTRVWFEPSRIHGPAVLRNRGFTSWGRASAAAPKSPASASEGVLASAGLRGAVLGADGVREDVGASGS